MSIDSLYTSVPLFKYTKFYQSFLSFILSLSIYIYIYIYI